MLDNLYGKFDSLVKKHELFKVETIGDAYMCVGNLRSSQPDHAHRIARFAMDAVVAAKSTLGAPHHGLNAWVRVRATVRVRAKVRGTLTSPPSPSALLSAVRVRVSLT